MGGGRLSSRRRATASANVYVETDDEDAIPLTSLSGAPTTIEQPAADVTSLGAADIGLHESQILLGRQLAGPVHLVEPSPRAQQRSAPEDTPTVKQIVPIADVRRKGEHGERESEWDEEPDEVDDEEDVDDDIDGEDGGEDEVNPDDESDYEEQIQHKTKLKPKNKPPSIDEHSSADSPDEEDGSDYEDEIQTTGRSKAIEKRPAWKAPQVHGDSEDDFVDADDESDYEEEFKPKAKSKGKEKAVLKKTIVKKAPTSKTVKRKVSPKKKSPAPKKPVARVQSIARPEPIKPKKPSSLKGVAPKPGICIPTVGQFTSTVRRRGGLSKSAKVKPLHPKLVSG